MQAAQSCPTLCGPMSYTVHGLLPARILEWGPFPSPGNLPNPGVEPRFPALQADSSPAEPPGKPKNTGVGSLSLLQRIFPAREWNRGLLHCGRILYSGGNDIPTSQGWMRTEEALSWTALSTMLAHSANRRRPSHPRWTPSCPPQGAGGAAKQPRAQGPREV